MGIGWPLLISPGNVSPTVHKGGNPAGTDPKHSLSPLPSRGSCSEQLSAAWLYSSTLDCQHCGPSGTGHLPLGHRHQALEMMLRLPDLRLWGWGRGSVVETKQGNNAERKGCVC